jgi:membrane protease YdiL (CAAX protease family)
MERMPDEPDKPLPIAFFLPEIIGVAVLVLLSPLWCVRLVYQGYAVYGCLILLIAITGTLGFVWLMIKRRRFVALLIMVAVLLAFLLVLSCLPSTVRLTIGQEPRTANQISSGRPLNTPLQNDQGDVSSPHCNPI